MGMKKLNDHAVDAVGRQPGMHRIDSNLYLRRALPPSEAKSWCFRYTVAGRTREMGLGSYPEISLAKARAAAKDLREKIAAVKAKGEVFDPIAERDAARVKAELAAARAKTFKEVATDYIAENKSAWKNEKHAAQWSSTLDAYVYPTFGHLPAAAIDAPLVKKVLSPIWTSKPETASRVRQRIEAVLDYAAAHDYRDKSVANPAALKGNIRHILPKQPRKAQRVAHHAALPYDEMGDFIALLRAQNGVAARALEFVILTAARTGEVIGATWAEIDLDSKVWTIPAERMKGGAKHRVPLSAPAVDVLEAMKEVRVSDCLFPGIKPKSPISDMAMLVLLRRMGRGGEITAHGFRSTFRDWCSEQTAYPREVAEQALAHKIGSAVEQAYRRTDLFERRRRLMIDWGAFCNTRQAKVGADNVVTLRVQQTA